MAASLLINFPDGHRCAVRLGTGALEALPELWDRGWQEAVLIGDATVMALYGERVAALLRPLVTRLLTIEFAPGEANKTRETKALLEDRMLEARVSRRACLIALGGGISLDLAGFVAATYLRGIAWCNVPTSLLAQVDAAIGGKTGVNTPHGKNLVGLFHQPAAVFVDPAFLSSLSVSEWRNGLAEMVKHAVIADATFFAWLEDRAAGLANPGPVDEHPLRRCLEIKAAVVSRDQRETGVRAILNFGHTVGHALEHASRHRLGHGVAVAAGMVVEARLAQRLCGFPSGELARLESLLRVLGLPAGPPPGLPFAELLPFLRVDKKRSGEELRLALPRRLGECARDGEAHTLAASALDLQRAFEETACSA